MLLLSRQKQKLYQASQQQGSLSGVQVGIHGDLLGSCVEEVG